MQNVISSRASSHRDSAKRLKTGTDGATRAADDWANNDLNPLNLRIGAPAPRPAAQSYSQRNGHHESENLQELATELRRELAEVKAKLQKADEERQAAIDTAETRAAFLANMSHELRTPLNAILGFSEVLKDEMFGPIENEKYKEYAAIIHGSGSHLLSLINDVLDMSKLDAGKLELNLSSVELFKLILSCVRSVETLSRDAQVGICIEMHDGIQTVSADVKRMRQMILNLLSNAIKFTKPGGEVRISVYRTGDSVAISVADTGVGMDQDDIPKVLEPYVQVGNDLHKSGEGTGLGLPLTKELAELHGGALTVESEIDVGTTATILLPQTH
jgi:signal transduction histidine kinase